MKMMILKCKSTKIHCQLLNKFQSLGRILLPSLVQPIAMSFPQTIIRFFKFGFASDSYSEFVRLSQNVSKYWDGNAFQSSKM